MFVSQTDWRLWDSAALVASFLSEEYLSKFVGQLRSSSEDGLFIIAVDVQ